MNKQTSILLVDDHAMLRKGLRALIEQEQGLSVIDEAGDGLEAIEKVRDLQPDVVVMDINMPRLNGIEATRRIICEAPETRILALSIHSSKRYVEEMLDAGIAGYLLKESAPEELLSAIWALRDGKCYLSTEITEIVIEKARETTSAAVNSPGNRRDPRKLQKPELPEGMVHRRELIERLEKNRSKKLSIVVAPAGYGKSTLVCDWLNTHEHTNNWCFLDNNDNDLQVFLKSWLAALDQLFPENGNYLRPLLEAANLPPVSILAGSMVADLQELPQKFILVLDNMHLVTEKSVFDLLSQVLRQPVEMMHLVMISRTDPFLPLTSLRAGNMLHEIRTEDLKFSTVDIQRFLQKTLNKNIDLETAAQWEERTDGWVAGLQLAQHNATSTHDKVHTKASSGKELIDWRNILTNREIDVLLLLQQRLRDKEIADQLCISTGTVRTHLKNLYSKLDATNRRDVVVKAEKLQILN